MLTSVLSADFLKDEIYVAGKRYPVGYFAVRILNDYYADDTALRLAVINLELYPLLDGLSVGVVKEEQFMRFYEMLLQNVKTLQKIEPFSLFDFSKEEERLHELFSEDNVMRLKEYQLYKASFAKHNTEYLPYLNRDEKTVAQGERLETAFKAVFAFYGNIADDMQKVRQDFIAFIAQLDTLPKCNESNLILLAEQIVKQNAADTQVEYAPLKQGKKVTLARRMAFTRWRDFLIADFYEALQRGHFPKRCAICKRYFLSRDARKRLYCDEICPSDAQGRSCRRVALASTTNQRRQNLKDTDPVQYLFEKRLKALGVDIHRGKIDEEFRQAAKKLMKEYKFRAYQEYDTYFLSGAYEQDLKAEHLYAQTRLRLEE